MGDRTAVKLPKVLCQKASEAAQKAGYSSLEELIESAVEREIARITTPENETPDEVLHRLKGLGYID